VHEVVKPPKEPRNANDDDEQPKKNKWWLLDSSDDDEEGDDDDVHKVIAKSNAKAAANASTALKTTLRRKKAVSRDVEEDDVDDVHEVVEQPKENASRIEKNAKKRHNVNAAGDAPAANANAMRDSSAASDSHGSPIQLLHTFMEQFEADKVTADEGKVAGDFQTPSQGEFHPPKCCHCKRTSPKNPSYFKHNCRSKGHVLLCMDHLIMCEGTCPEIKSKTEALEASLEAAADPSPTKEARTMVKAEWGRLNPGKKFEEFGREVVAKAGMKATKRPGRKMQNERAPAKAVVGASPGA